MVNKPRKLRFGKYPMLPAFADNRPGSSIILAVGIVFLLFLFFTGSDHDDDKDIRLASIDDSVIISMPTREVVRGETLKDIPFSDVSWPRSRLPDGILTKVDGKESWVTTTPLARLAPVPLSALSEVKVDLNAVAQGIPEGMRAITIRVDMESSVEGWARSGSYVDVVLITSSGVKKRDLEAQVISENVRILSAGRSVEPGEPSTLGSIPTSVTLLVTQEDALKIKTATSVGKITFTMRGTGDKDPTSVLNISEQQLARRKFSDRFETSDLKGTATGPDGRTWVLTNGSKWIATKMKSSFAQEPSDSATDIVNSLISVTGRIDKGPSSGG